jgi:hypothetical protein
MVPAVSPDGENAAIALTGLIMSPINDATIVMIATALYLVFRSFMVMSSLWRFLMRA